MEINDFTEYYSTISNAELLDILDNPRGYQPIAIEAAKKEFVKRQLSEEDIKEAKEPMINDRMQKEKQKKKLNAIEEKVKATGNTLIETLNPIQSGITSTEKIIRLVVIVFSARYLYEVITEFRYIIITAEDSYHSPLITSLGLLPFILLPVAVFTFWKRKSIGWVLLTIYLTIIATSVFWQMVSSYGQRRSQFSWLERLYPSPSPSSYILSLIFLMGMLYVLCKPNVREVYSIRKETISKVIIMPAILELILLVYVK